MAMTSPNGINWTARSVAASYDWTSVTYGNGLFVAVSQTGAGDRVMTSPNGIAWTLRRTPADINWYSVTFGDGIFVAVAHSGSGSRVMTSPDGIAWTLRATPADLGWRSVAYGNGLYVAVADSGSGSRAMTSPDGIAWTLRATPTNETWFCVASGNDRYVAVAITGTANRVMTLTAPTSLEIAADEFSVQPWHRLLPLTTTSILDIGVDISVNASNAVLRLVRLSGTVTSNIECVLTAYQSRADPVVLSNSTQTTTGNLVANPILYESTRITQVGGFVGIGTSNPTSTLSVGGTTSVGSLVADNTIVSNSVGLHVSTTALSNTTPLVQGAYMSWNHNGGDGKTDFVCKRGGGTGGFDFMRSNGSGTAFSDGKLSLANLGTNGMSSTLFSAPGAVIGSLFATATDNTITQGVTVISPAVLSSAVNGTSWITIATLLYTPKSTSSRLFIHFDMDYVMNGSATDTVSSAIFLGGTDLIQKAQVFRGTNSGSGTRSGTIFPISAIVNNTTTATRTITVAILFGTTFDDLIALSPLPPTSISPSMSSSVLMITRSSG